MITGRTMNKTAIRLSLWFSALCLPACAAEAESTVVLEPSVARYDVDAMPKDPLASAFFSATLPGTGQLYNKEYLRGAITGACFWGSILAIDYCLWHWEVLNTDTFYIEEAYGNPPPVHQAYSLKPESEMVGLPTGEKVLLGTTIALAAASYVWGIYDSYQGAKRYNLNLALRDVKKLSFDAGVDPVGKRAEIKVRYLF
jgi:TM2 domain-containing membrane protein YozV